MNYIWSLCTVFSSGIVTIAKVYYSYYIYIYLVTEGTSLKEDENEFPIYSKANAGLTSQPLYIKVPSIYISNNLQKKSENLFKYHNVNKGQQKETFLNKYGRYTYNKHFLTCSLLVLWPVKTFT